MIRAGPVARFLILTGFSALVLVLFTFALFALFDRSPVLCRALNLSRIRYFSAKDRLVTDEVLVFRKRPFLELTSSNFRGDLYSPAYGVEVRPLEFHATYDRHGFRNPSSASPAADIVVLGDSYMEIGHDDEDTFSERLRRVTGRSTVNLGLEWYGPFQYVAALEKYGIGLEPRYALFGFFQGNDIRDTYWYLKWMEGKPYYQFAFTSGSFLKRYRLAVHDIGGFLQGLLERKGPHVAPGDGARGEIHPDLAELNLGGEEIKVTFGFQYRENALVSLEQLLRFHEWRQLKDILVRFRDVCREHDIIPVVLFIPQKSRVYGAYSSGRSGKNWLRIKNGQDAADRNFEAAFARLCDEVGLRLVNLTPAFAELARKGQLLYYPFDTHWNSPARQAAAEYVAGELAITADP